MRRKTETTKPPAEKVVRDIRRRTRKHHSAEEKTGSCWRGFAARRASENAGAGMDCRCLPNKSNDGKSSSLGVHNCQFHGSSFRFKQ